MERLEAKARGQNKTAAQSYQAEVEVWKLRKIAAQTHAKEKLKTNAHADLSDLAGIEGPRTPLVRRFIVNDCTYEKLGEILADNPNGVLAFRDEIISLLNPLDREENASAKGFYLTAWNRTSGYTFDRIIRGNTNIEAACVSLLGSTQPGRLTDYMRGAMRGGAGDDGLIQRFSVLVWPDHSGDWKNVDRYPDGPARQNAHALFERLSEIDPACVGAQSDSFAPIPFVRFDEGGLAVFSEWRAAHEVKLRAGDLHPALESHLAKYRKLVPFGEIPVLRALALAEYLETHARRAYAASVQANASIAKSILASSLITVWSQV